MKLIRRGIRWPLLPILVAGVGNVWLWYRVLLDGQLILAAGFIGALSILAGMTTPRPLHPFARICLMIPALLYPTASQGPLIFSVLFGPVEWIFLAAVWTPVYGACAALLWFGNHTRESVPGRLWLRPAGGTAGAGGRKPALPP